MTKSPCPPTTELTQDQSLATVLLSAPPPLPVMELQQILVTVVQQQHHLTGQVLGTLGPLRPQQAAV